MEVKELTDIRDLTFIGIIQDKLEKINYDILTNDVMLYIQICYNELEIFYDKSIKQYSIFDCNSHMVLHTYNIEDFLEIFNLIHDKRLIYLYDGEYEKSIYENGICYIIQQELKYLTIKYNEKIMVFNICNNDIFVRIQ
jgi:hypothetical protein